jgi:hypothetical protein
MLQQCALLALLVASSRAATSCIDDPTQASCASYQYDGAAEDIKTNCFMMPWMIGCGVNSMCKNGSIPDSSPYCQPFSILATSCVDDGMADMGGCMNYTKLCSSGSVVKQCTQQPPIPRVVHTSSSQVRTSGGTIFSGPGLPTQQTCGQTCFHRFVDV